MHFNLFKHMQEQKQKTLSEAAIRALKEAQERREKHIETSKVEEIDGRGGLDPARYLDWEIKGKAVDF